MAIKTSWTAGQVLAAADLTDTFAAKAALAGATYTGTHDFTSATVTGVGPTVQSATVATQQSTASVTYTDLATAGPAVTLTTGTSVLVILSAELTSSGGFYSYMSFAVSGATTVAASDTNSIRMYGNNNTSAARSFILTGLTAGSNTFTTKYRASGGTSSIAQRDIVIVRL